MKLIIMTKPTFFVEEDKILTTLFEEGLDNLHLFKPNSAPVYSERLLTLLADDYRKRIMVHDHLYLKDEYRLKGININSATADVPTGYKGNVSRTCRSIEELKTICRCGKKAMFNARKINGKFVFEGEQVAIDNENNVEYESLCPVCYLKEKNGK